MRASYKIAIVYIARDDNKNADTLETELGSSLMANSKRRLRS